MSAIKKRIECLLAILRGSVEVRHLGRLSAIRSLTRSFGGDCRTIRANMRPVPIGDDCYWIDFGLYGLVWPMTASLDELAFAMIEVLEPSQPHYYLAPLTPMRRGFHVVDVGACEGNFAMEALFRHSAGQVYAFEPNRVMVHALQTAAEKNQVTDRLHIIEAAVGRRAGSIEFSYEEHNPLMGKIGTERGASRGIVQVMTIDEWVADNKIPRIDYIKSDAEGSDVDVLYGAEQTIRRWKPSIAVTTYHTPGHANEMVEFLTSLHLGYEMHVKGIMSHKGIPRPIMLHAAVR